MGLWIDYPGRARCREFDMSYPMSHKIIKRFPYTPANQTDIRATFAKARRDAANQNRAMVDADPVPAGTAQRSDQGISTAECH